MFGWIVGLLFGFGVCLFVGFVTCCVCVAFVLFNGFVAGVSVVRWLLVCYACLLLDYLVFRYGLFFNMSLCLLCL